MLGLSPSKLARSARTFTASIGLIGLAIASALSGSDRQSREFPNSPSFIGWPYDTGAAQARATLAFFRSGPASAISYARRAILSDPISAQPISMLGRANLFAQRTLEANKAFHVSGQLGWRDPMTQIYLFDQALQGGDYRVAAERLDALLRESPELDNRDRLIAAIAATPEGREAVARRLMLAPPWAESLITEVRDLPPDELLQRLDLMKRTRKAVWDCPTSEFLTQRFIKIGMLNEAQTTWRIYCNSASSLVYDGGFDHINLLIPASAFGWQVSNRGDAEVVLASNKAGNPNLALDVTAVTTLPILSQLVVLKPGRYRLTWRTPDTKVADARALQVSLACSADFGLAAGGLLDGSTSDTWSREFKLTGDCPAQLLVFWLAPKAQIHVDDVSLVPIGVKIRN